MPGHSLCFVVRFLALCAVAIPCIALALRHCEQSLTSEPNLYQIESVTATSKTAYNVAA